MHDVTQTLDRPPSLKLLEGYAAQAGIHDEMMTDDGLFRPRWGELARQLDTLGGSEISRRMEQARRLIQENGVTFNVYGDPRGMDRPWQLDAIPLLITPQEWTHLEAGLIQRATLIDMMLADLYGPQKLLREGLMPPELVLAHPGFLRPCHGIKVPNDRYLHLYAIDIGRASDGRFLVLSNRTQAPGGAGYALENRMVLSRTLPEVFRESQVHRLAGFFAAMRNTLTHLAQRHRDNPRIALLTPGPYNEAYFEHAYLARYLGFTLVEGGDLTVRDRCLFLKTLGGLQQVDVVFRRLDDDFCDPLELRANSTLGVPGLVDAVRAGNATIANALGSGLLQTSAVLPFMPLLCRKLLGEDLKIPSAVTWWCGEPAVLQHVLENLDKMVIKTTYPMRGFDTALGSELSRAEVDALADRIRAHPHCFVAQELTALSTMPVWNNQKLEPRLMTMRSYIAAADDGFKVMPGGLTRVSAADNSKMVTIRKGGGSKDTWVLSDRPVEYVSLLNRTSAAAIELSRDGGGLPSRVADNLYWLGRYAERADAMLRLLRCILLRLADRSNFESTPELPTLLRTLTHSTLSYPGFVGEGSEERLENPEPELLAVIFDSKTPGSLRSTISLVHGVIAIVRDRLSTDAWRILYQLHQDFMQQAQLPAYQTQIADLLSTTNRMIITLAAFGGLASESMTRGQGWRFLDMGRRIERAVQTISLLRAVATLSNADGSSDQKSAESSEPTARQAYEQSLQSILEVADSIMTYRRRYQTSMQLPAALDLMLTDETNPRSVGFQLALIADHIEHLPGERHMPARSPEQRIIMGLTAAVRLCDIERLCKADSKGHRAELDELLDRLALHLPALSETISKTFLSHTQVSRQLSTTIADISANPINTL